MAQFSLSDQYCGHARLVNEEQHFERKLKFPSTPYQAQTSEVRT